MEISLNMKVMAINFLKTSVTDYLDEIRQHFANINKKLKSIESPWVMNFILGLYYYYKKDDKRIEKEIFIKGVYGVIMLEINTHDFIEKNIKSVENRYEKLHKKIEGSSLVLTVWAN